MDSDDEFGLSDGDEAALLQVEQNNPLKRKSDSDLGSAAKVARTNGSISPTVELANEVLQNRFRINSFRLKQETAIDRLLQGDSAVVVFPTGIKPAFSHGEPD